MGSRIGNTNGFKKGHIPKNKGLKSPGIGGRPKGGVPWNKGKKLSEEHKKKLSLAKKGKNPPNKGVKYSFEIRKRMSDSRKKGAKSHFWRGGITSPVEVIRKSFEYKLWRDSVFARDRYTCIWCGTKSGNGKAVILNADHIKPFALFPELRFAIDNGRTLCVDCHKTTNTYGGRTRKKLC